MSIIINDLDNLLVDLCDLESDYFNLMCTNKHYYRLISNNQLFSQWKVIKKNMNTKYKTDLFIESCRRGFLLFSKYLVIKHNIDIHEKDEYAFQLSCKYGYFF